MKANSPSIAQSCIARWGLWFFFWNYLNLEINSEWELKWQPEHFQPCKSTYEFGIKSQLQQHLKTALHIKNLERFSARPERQLLLNEVQGNGKTEFFTDMCEAFLAADIPWKTLCQPKFRGFLEKYTENTIPNESTLRKNYLPRLYTKVSNETHCATSMHDFLCGFRTAGCIWLNFI